MVAVFSIPIFFVAFRESLEAIIIVAVLLSLVEQLMISGTVVRSGEESGVDEVHDEMEKERLRRVVKRMRIQIWAGAGAGLAIALTIGAVFLAIFYTLGSDLWAKSEQIWEGVFCLIAACLIYFMGIALVAADRGRVAWRIKLSEAFDGEAGKALKAEGLSGDGSGSGSGSPGTEESGPFERRVEISEAEQAMARKKARRGKWALFLLPFITVLREGLETVIFIGGVSLNVPASSIPLAVIVGLGCGALCGYLIYRGGNAVALHWFLIASTTFLFLIGAGLLSKGIGFLQYYKFAKGVGGDVSEAGDGPGSFRIAGNVWHLTYGNPEAGSASTNGGYQLANAIVGWNNTATVGTIVGYCAFWIAVTLALIYRKWTEGRVTFFGRGSAAYWRLKKHADVKRAEQDHQAVYDDAPGSATLSNDDKTTEETPTSVLTMGRHARQESQMSIEKNY